MTPDPTAGGSLREQLEALVLRWRARAEAIVDDVNHGHAPTHEADTARGWSDCANELDAVLRGGASPHPQLSRIESIEHQLRVLAAFGDDGGRIYGFALREIADQLAEGRGGASPGETAKQVAKRVGTEEG